MYVSSTSLPHLLPPSAYSSPEQYDREIERLFRGGWHVVATRSQLARPGDFVTRQLCNVPLQIRNFAGELRAVSNVCAHRHCLISHAAGGNTAAMRCQYHGWEYGEDGRTRRIPAPKNFVPMDREVHCLPTYRLECCGQLVFVSLASEGPELSEYLGDFYAVCAERFGADWQESLAWEPEYEVNWKVPIENSLEAYHVPYIHPETFREDPGPERSTHLLLAHRTALGSRLPFSPHSRLDRWFQSGEQWLLRRLGLTPTGEYWQHHLFPNLMFSFTDAISLCHGVVPMGPRASQSFLRQFSRVPAGVRGWRRGLAVTWGRLASGVTRRIVAEDLGLFQDLQRGLDASTRPGILGACEERIHAFQQFLIRACELDGQMSTRPAQTLARTNELSRGSDARVG